MIKPQSYNEFRPLESGFAPPARVLLRLVLKKILEHRAVHFVYHDEVMAFCTNCGTQVKDDARFCANCGSAMGAAASNLPGTYVPPPPPEPLKYDIEGHNLQVARVHLQPGQEIFAEAGKMVYKTSNVSWETRMSGTA